MKLRFSTHNENEVGSCKLLLPSASSKIVWLGAANAGQSDLKTPQALHIVGSTQRARIADSLIPGSHAPGEGGP